MARKRIVSRTVKATRYDLLCVDIDSAEVYNDSITLGGKFPTPEKELKACEKAYNNEHRKVVAIVGHEPVEQMYAMDEADFIAHAYTINK